MLNPHARSRASAVCRHGLEEVRAVFPLQVGPQKIVGRPLDERPARHALCPRRNVPPAARRPGAAASNIDCRLRTNTGTLGVTLFTPNERNSRPSGSTSHHLPLSCCQAEKRRPCGSFGPPAQPPKRSRSRRLGLARSFVSSAARCACSSFWLCVLPGQSPRLYCPKMSTILSRSRLFGGYRPHVVEDPAACRLVGRRRYTCHE